MLFGGKIGYIKGDKGLKFDHRVNKIILYAEGPVKKRKVTRDYRSPSRSTLEAFPMTHKF